MTAKGMVRSAAVMLGAAVLWGTPIIGAQARGYHPNPPRQAPAPQDPSGTQGQGSKPQQASPESKGETPEGCFRRYDDRCQRARESRRRQGGAGD
ncbi:MAG: hypothetical protein LC792_17465 [Actinobacteria bacterium]|nr:hypothetical protein [Actinomycetota bacterium]